MSKTILFVDDYDDIRSAAEAILSVLGFTVLLAQGGREAVEAVLRRKPDLILMDLAMPEYDGIDAAREIRSYPEFMEIPMIAVSSYNQYLRNDALAAGYNDVVDKGRFFTNPTELVDKYLQ